MIYCKECGYEGIYTGLNCSQCGARIRLDEREMLELKKEVKAAKEAGEYETVVENLLILADMGDTVGEREYAKLLESNRGAAIGKFRALPGRRQAMRCRYKSVV